MTEEVKTKGELIAERLEKEADEILTADGSCSEGIRTRGPRTCKS